jgi:uncharacterized paraquat-inducible protein A
MCGGIVGGGGTIKQFLLIFSYNFEVFHLQIVGIMVTLKVFKLLRHFVQDDYPNFKMYFLNEKQQYQ